MKFILHENFFSFLSELKRLMNEAKYLFNFQDILLNSNEFDRYLNFQTLLRKLLQIFTGRKKHLKNATKFG